MKLLAALLALSAALPASATEYRLTYTQPGEYLSVEFSDSVSVVDYVWNDPSLASYIDTGPLRFYTVDTDHSDSPYSGGFSDGDILARGDALFALESDSVSFSPLSEDIDYWDTDGNLLSGAHVSIAAVPEPSTWAAMLLGLALVGIALRKSTTAEEYTQCKSQ